jgi:hypothetical protein
MKPITSEWADKAEGGFATAQRELNVPDHPNYDAVCFHAQQCVEKYLKACLQEGERFISQDSRPFRTAKLGTFNRPGVGVLEDGLEFLKRFRGGAQVPGRSRQHR